MPPRVAKAYFTNREALQLKRYARHHPIDDQSNHHLPVAHLHASMRNMMGGKVELSDLMIFREREEMHIDDLLLSDPDLIRVDADDAMGDVDG